MSESGDEFDQRWVDSAASPLGDVSYRRHCADELNASGALVLRGLFTDAFVSSVLDNCAEREDEAFFAASTHNIWLTPPDESLPTEHIFNRQIRSTKGLLADDQVSANSALRAVYDSADFRDFIAAVVGTQRVFPYDDDLSSINVHFHRDGEELGWHFDNSSFAVTTLIQAPEGGGQFEYVKDLRDSANNDQNFDGVARAVDTDEGVETLSFEPGDLVLFRGRDSMHRVTPSAGSTTRILVVFAFNTQPGIGLSESAKRTFYGRS